METFNNYGIHQEATNNSKNVINIGSVKDSEMFVYKEVALQEGEWNMLKDFLVNAQLGYDSTDERFHLCGTAASQAERRDKTGLKETLGRIGRTALNTMLETCTNTAMQTVAGAVIGRLLGM